MENKLVTLAIFTFEKAQIVKTILEGEGIAVSIQNVNQIQPVISAGVRLRIRESDLPKALRIVEDLNLSQLVQSNTKSLVSDNEDDEDELDDMIVDHTAPDSEAHKAIRIEHKNVILVPVDFSDYSYKACVWAIHFANDLDSEVQLLHAVYSPFYIANTFAPDAGFNPAQALDIQQAGTIESTAKDKMKSLVAQLKNEMSDGVLPHVRLRSLVVQGIPEDMIIQVSKKLRARLIIMGSRGNTNRNFEMIGSVTAEVIDRCKVPILAVPENVKVHSFSEVKNIGFATSFAQKDLIYFDLFMELIGRYDMNIHLFNISTSNSEWDDIRMNGVKEYFQRQYPEQVINYHVLDSGDRLQAIQKLLMEQEIRMVALPIAKKSLWIRMFNPSLAQKMLFSTEIPLLVFNVR